MRTPTLLGLLALAGACTTRPERSETAAGDVASSLTPSAAEFENAYSASTLDVASRVAVLGRYVRSIEARVPSAMSALGTTTLTRTSRTLPAHAFSDVTDEEWAQMDLFSDGVELKRLRLIPPAGADPRTEEFYFNNGNLVFVYDEPDGASKADPHTEVGGDSYYFGSEGLIEWVRGNGTRVDPSDPDFKAKSTKLLKEAERFPIAAPGR